MKFRDFTYVGDFGNVSELVAILSRIHGHVAEEWARDNNKSTLAHRQRIYYGQVANCSRNAAGNSAGGALS